jgi:hypothetical protein
VPIFVPRVILYPLVLAGDVTHAKPFSFSKVLLPPVQNISMQALDSNGERNSKSAGTWYLGGSTPPPGDVGCSSSVIATIALAEVMTSLSVQVRE